MKTKYERLADDLKKRILTLNPGMKLPSVRDIVRENGVSQFTVSRAIDLLEEEGYVKRRSTVGLYSSRPEHRSALEGTATRRILIMAPDIFFQTFVELLQEVLTRRGYLHRFRHYDLREPADTWLPRVRFEGMIFLGSCPPEVAAALQKNNIPFVCQGLRYAHQEVDNTCGDERFAGALAAKHLVELGHRKLAVLLNEPHTPDGNERVRGFVNQAKLMGAEARLLDCNTPMGANSCEAARALFEGELRKGPPDFTGLFVITDKGAMGVLHVCYEHGLRVPDRLSVVGCDNVPEAAYLCPSLTTLEYNHRDRCNGLIDILEQRFAGDTSPPIQKMYEPALVVRKSSGPAPRLQ
jgi:DNA-binding LacI/PurR family transcriptional regulator